MGIWQQFLLSSSKFRKRVFSVQGGGDPKSLAQEATDSRRDLPMVLLIAEVTAGTGFDESHQMLKLHVIVKRGLLF